MIYKGEQLPQLVQLRLMIVFRTASAAEKFTKSFMCFCVFLGMSVLDGSVLLVKMTTIRGIRTEPVSFIPKHSNTLHKQGYPTSHLSLLHHLVVVG